MARKIKDDKVYRKARKKRVNKYRFNVPSLAGFSQQDKNKLYDQFESKYTYLRTKAKKKGLKLGTIPFTRHGNVTKSEIKELVDFLNATDEAINLLEDPIDPRKELIDQLFKMVDDTYQDTSLNPGNQSQALIDYKYEGLKEVLNKLLYEGSMEEQQRHYDNLKRDYALISNKIADYFKDSDESYKSEEKHCQSDTFSVGAINAIKKYFTRKLSKYAEMYGENGTYVNNY